MIKLCKDQWDANKEKLEKALREDTSLNSCDYKYLLTLTVENILNYGRDDRYNTDKITVIDDGDYQGTLIFLVPRDTYQPDESEYLMTYVGYGSCSGCDTLLGIQGWNDGPPTEQQLREFMMLCKDMVTNMICPYNHGWRQSEEYESVDGI